jgi:hypothetical protein
MKSKIAMEKAAFKTKRKILFTSKLGLNLMKKALKCYMSNKAVCGNATRTLRKADQIHLGSL